MSYGERARANRAMLDQRDEGVGYNQFIQSNNNPVYNNIVSAFSTSAGASKSATIEAPV